MITSTEKRGRGRPRLGSEPMDVRAIRRRYRDKLKRKKQKQNAIAKSISLMEQQMDESDKALLGNHQEVLIYCEKQCSGILDIERYSSLKHELENDGIALSLGVRAGGQQWVMLDRNGWKQPIFRLNEVYDWDKLLISAIAAKEIKSRN